MSDEQYLETDIMRDRYAQFGNIGDRFIVDEAHLEIDGAL